jgi:hypothetical protein
MLKAAIPEQAQAWVPFHSSASLLLAMTASAKVWGVYVADEEALALPAPARSRTEMRVWWLNVVEARAHE